jgi:biopolymer transport protein ExbD
MRLPPADPENEWLNLTPLLDVVLNLLLFFLIATHFKEVERELDVKLPAVVSAQPLTGPQELIVNVTEDGKYKVAEQEYSEAQLRSLLKQNGAKNPHQAILIRGDGRSALEHSTRVMGLCNEAKLHYKLATILVEIRAEKR